MNTVFRAIPALRFILAMPFLAPFAGQASASTVTFADYIDYGGGLVTFEIYTEAPIPAAERGRAIINAPDDLGVMSWTLEGPFVSLVESTRSGSLLAGQSDVRNYFNDTTNDGSLTLFTAWMADAWNAGTDWTNLDSTERSDYIEDLALGLDGFIDFACTVNCGSGDDGGDAGSGDVEDTSPVPLPAGVWMLLAGLGGLGVLKRRKRTA